MLAYEAADEASPPPRGAILLVGDSQFYRWRTLAEDLPGYTVVNRGIDSFQASDLLHYADRLVLPYAPRLIVTHVGGNDVNNGKTPEQILADFQAFVAKVRVALPDVPIAFSSITPGPGRWFATSTDNLADVLEASGPSFTDATGAPSSDWSVVTTTRSPAYCELEWNPPNGCGNYFPMTVTASALRAQGPSYSTGDLVVLRVADGVSGMVDVRLSKTVL